MTFYDVQYTLEIFVIRLGFCFFSRKINRDSAITSRMAIKTLLPFQIRPQKENNSVLKTVHYYSCINDGCSIIQSKRMDDRTMLRMVY